MSGILFLFGGDWSPPLPKSDLAVMCDDIGKIIRTRVN